MDHYLSRFLTYITGTIILVIILTGFTNTSTSTATITMPKRVSSGSDLLNIQIVNIEIFYKNKFVPLGELIPESVQSEHLQDQDTLPRLKNNSLMRINASYSTFQKSQYDIVIWHFSIEVYEVVSKGYDTFNGSLGASSYRGEEPPEVVLPPNSSKAELIYFKLKLPSSGTYKFSFRALASIRDGIEDPVDVFYFENISFNLVRFYEDNPDIILYLFFGVTVMFIAIIGLGIYGNRKYKDI